MAIRAFRAGCTYRHRNPACTTDLLVVKVRYADPKKAILLVKYIHKVGGRVQYTGRRDGFTDEVRILAKSYQDWTYLDPNSKQEDVGQSVEEINDLRRLCEES